jgi:diamine N-acetyltransferase
MDIWNDLGGIPRKHADIWKDSREPSNLLKIQIHEVIPVSMVLRFEEITGDNYHECISLEVSPDQADCFYFKSSKPNVMSLAEAYVFKNGSQVLAVYDDDLMVGALFYTPNTNPGNPNDSEGKAWLTRLMIDKRYQGKGYGRKTMEMLIERVRKEGAKSLGLSYEPHNKVAEALYLSLGFRVSGEAIGEGQIVAWLELL